MEIKPGDTCVVSRDILIDSRLVFSENEHVVVEKIDPNPERPEYKYVTCSRTLNTRFQLSDADIQALGVSQPETTGQERQRHLGLWIIPGLVVLAVMGITVALALLYGGSKTGPIVCIDPGHGGNDTGARENGVLEKDVNLDIALRTRPLLEEMGYQVIMTRDKDTTVSLAERCATANGSGASVLVSIHNNAPPPDAEGTVTYCYRGSLEGRSLAMPVQQEVVKRIKRVDRGVKEANFFVLRNANMPAALLEAVFLSNAEEARLIVLSGFQQRISEGVAAGVDDYLKGR